MNKNNFEEIKTIVEEVFFGRNGNECEENEAFAKHMTVNGGDSYFIWFSSGVPYDPYSGEILRRNSPLCKFKSVKKEMFDHYIKYLKTKKIIHMTHCRRVSLR